MGPAESDGANMTSVLIHSEKDLHLGKTIMNRLTVVTTSLKVVTIKFKTRGYLPGSCLRGASVGGSTVGGGKVATARMKQCE